MLLTVDPREAALLPEDARSLNGTEPIDLGIPPILPNAVESRRCVRFYWSAIAEVIDFFNIIKFKSL